MSRHFEFFRDTYDVTEIAGAGARRVGLLITSLCMCPREDSTPSTLSILHLFLSLKSMKTQFLNRGLSSGNHFVQYVKAAM